MTLNLWSILLVSCLSAFIFVALFIRGCAKQTYMSDEEIEADIENYNRVNKCQDSN